MPFSSTRTVRFYQRSSPPRRLALKVIGGRGQASVPGTYMAVSVTSGRLGDVHLRQRVPRSRNNKSPKEARVWKYDRGDGRCKHLWHHDYAGHVTNGRRVIGKCPKSFTQEKAEVALNNGYEYYERRGETGSPSRIFAVVDGVVYRAMPTLPGISFHGFPELAADLPNDPTLRAAILELADADDSRNEVEKWLNS